MRLQLDRIQKIAFARILFDIIEADFIIEESEMTFLEKVISSDGLNISDAMLVEAKRMKLDKVVAILKEVNDTGRKSIIEILKNLALTDGTSVPLEAILIFALMQVLEHDAYIYSVPANNLDIVNMTAIFIENHKTPFSLSIEQYAHIIRQELAMSGFDFVYIPHVVSDYQRMNRIYLHKVVNYMIPSFSSEKIDEICHELQSMTTARFCRDILYKKIDIPLLDVPPSLLIKMNESALVEQYDADDAERTNYANFLRIELREDVVAQIQELMASYRRMVNCPINVTTNPPSQKFLYRGFHRSLFDLIAFSREKKTYNLIFDLTSKCAQVYFEPTDGTNERIPLRLNPQETALYIMIVKESWSGIGLDWRDNPPQQVRDDILKEYNRIYSHISKGKTTRVYKDRTRTHHIKNKIQSISCIANMELFVPIHIKEGIHSYYCVKATSDNIRIIE